MAWNVTTPLTNAAITSAKLEQATLDLWAEYLGGYFSGTSHGLDGATTTFPLVGLSFQADKLPAQPTNGTVISVVWDRPAVVKPRLQQGKRVSYIKARFTFYIRSAGQNTGDGGPKVAVKKACDLLFALLSSKAETLPLAMKGIHHVRPQQASVQTMNELIERRMSVNAVLVFE